MTSPDLKAIATNMRLVADTIDPPVATPAPTTVPTTTGLQDRGKFKLNRAEYFNTDCAEGEFARAYQGKLTCYPANYLDTQGQKGSGSHYDPNNLSVRGGFLCTHVRPGKVLADVIVNGKTMAKKGDFCGTAAAAQLVDSNNKVLTQTYGRWEERTMADPVSGYKRATMLWPGSYQWTDGEIDWIEGALNGTMEAHNHYPGDPENQDNYPKSGSSGIKLSDWHVYAVEWIPGLVSFFIDEKLVATSTKAPTKPMFWNEQIEANIGGTQPTARDDGYVYTDYIGQWSYTG